MIENNREYKSTSVFGVGNIPVEWTLPKIAYVTNKIGSGKTPSGGSDNYADDGVMFLRSQNIYNEGLAVENVSYIPDNIDNDMKNTRVQYGDVLLNITGGSIGRCCIFDLKNTAANVNQHVCIIRTKQDMISNSFMRYYLISGVGKALIDYVQTGGNREGLNFEQIKNARIPLPRRSEQNLITTHLDHKTARINHLIADKERLIALLKEERQAIISEAVTKGLDRSAPMKDSGIEWLGEIPSHWGISKSQWLFALRKDKAFPEDEQLTASQQHGIVYQKDYMERGSRVVQVITGADILKHVEPDDFVISMRSFQGGIEWSNLRGKISSAYVMLIPNKELVFPPFFKWLLKSNNYILALQSTSNLVRDGQALRYDNFKQVDLPLIPLTEQQAIADYLYEKTNSIDTLIQDIQSQINLLKEYRQSVISEAVTGKYITPTMDAPQEIKPAKQANLHFKRRVLAAKILDELCEEPTLGHVKLEKLLFLSEYCAQLDLHTQYDRHAAGPYNPKVLRSIDSQLKKAKWFDYRPSADTSNKYTRMPDCENYIDYYEKYFDDGQRNVIDKLILLFRTSKTIQCEIVATLYGAWNDFLLEGMTPSDSQIIDEVLSNWHEKKERIARERWQRALNWMRDNAIVPIGYGESTKGGAS